MFYVYLKRRLILGCQTKFVKIVVTFVFSNIVAFNHKIADSLAGSVSSGLDDNNSNKQNKKKQPYTPCVLY